LLRPIALGYAGVGLPCARTQWETPARADGAIGQEKAGEVLHPPWWKFSKNESLQQNKRADAGRASHRARSGCGAPKIGIRARQLLGLS